MGVAVRGTVRWRDRAGDREAPRPQGMARGGASGVGAGPQHGAGGGRRRRGARVGESREAVRAGGPVLVGRAGPAGIDAVRSAGGGGKDAGLSKAPRDLLPAKQVLEGAVQVVQPAARALAPPSARQGEGSRCVSEGARQG
ncbi:uncharacterized protein LOC126304688 [Schistocerca gregaria]|uniref:uncharacterized protein LOC126304688 n=1 Tax=Schistocerca gregaria TaxID=7010 RepID=UPI00211F2CC4|nr:uncharacterized protein LOC126304688 [Schistocerca gregaria]